MTNIVCFSQYLTAYKCWSELSAALARQQVDYALLPNTKDIWMRDFMPIQCTTDHFVAYRYEPDYLRGQSQYITNLKLLDSKTGKFVQKLDMEKIRNDSLVSEQYQEVCSIIEYVRNDMGRDTFTEKYGKWSWYDSDFNKNRHSEPMGDYYYCLTPVHLGEYNIMLPSDNYSIQWGDGIVRVKRDDKVVLVYPINERAQNNSQLLDTPDSLFLWRNDSLMLVLNNIYVDSNGTVRAGSNNFLLFRKAE